MKQTLRSPLKDPPLRTPGQSLREERARLLDDKLEPPFFLALFFAALAGLEWYRSFVPTPPMPWLYTFAAIVALAFAAWRLRRYRPLLRSLRQGLEGELVVGQYLEGLRASGYRVFHDVVGDGFNIDHVLIGPSGIYTIETKTWSKPQDGDARVRFDGDRLVIGSLLPDKDPIVQARDQAHWLRTLLEESCGRRLETKPVILFPGWFVEPLPRSIQNLWVLEPKALSGFLKQERAVLAPDDVAMASTHLSRFIRLHQRSAPDAPTHWTRDTKRSADR